MDLQSSVPHEQLVAAVKDIVPILDSSSYKGQSGKVGVMGGCREYTGAPFFAATSSLRMGCDLAYVFCTPAAAPVIKGYSPELIVLPDLIDTEESSKLLAEGSRSALTGLHHLGGDCWSEGDTYLTKRFNDNIRPWLERLSVLIIGPGLGSDAWVGRCMRETVAAARELNLPLIIDGSGLNFVAETPEIVAGYSSCILTPNIAEFGRLAKAVGVELPGKIGVHWQQQSRELAAALGGPLLLSKGREDVITDGTQLLLVQADGSPRRCGGQGDVLTDTPLVWVDTPKRLRSMLQQLQGAAVIGLDTEHTAHRSYLGVTCLLQLSTGTTDYLVDCLALHDCLGLLRPLLADGAVLKVLHGGANDVLWLQRDAHLYLVNVFDTEKAALVLGREERSLANLLRRYCGVTQDKAHQTADWRLRPLPQPLRQYARGDVHWLPYLAGQLVAELQARSPSTNAVGCNYL
ncbi:hypothetical protein OEZ85_004230 [Tetradesmus obliquus]|uniref:ATP-dependent (S)-NAD(P)H-hydrate dehydratase n=1 Tax=Tetradesmus obliquus TaxID=3088 RepID=A0ABY8UKE9_TETOB|nr:hypothetical protein OEZ85_004230 [Tetradesmus obliquus]